MRRAIRVLAAGFVVLLAGGAFALPGALQEPTVEESSALQASGEPAPAQSGTEGQADAGVVSEMMTDQEEAALRLVEEILEEQHMILAGQNFVYRSDGRRDPFRNILSLRRREIEAPTERPPGLAGFLVSEVQVTAAALFQGRWHVLLTGLDQRTYTATVGTELYDGRIVSISVDQVVFEQEVQDMLGARSSRQVIRKLNEDQD